MVFNEGVNNASCVERRAKGSVWVGVVAREELVGVVMELGSTEVDLSSHFSVISLIFFAHGVIEPLPGDIFTFACPLNVDENDKSRGLSASLATSVVLLFSLFIAN